ncbi:NACHT, LRR and PYD domains-containing protein 5 [Beauveria bassiana D1-5]|uniref:NACHT, LRR and PYD domains-containing protein 5 n=1 Tax=Beauveria bassiana D1-5 TaxID=1245745 RepID=A0A0A2VUN0_BEABA|nr:NACHT, LRR and PYD domains-containing protein 5 [Beauveria bassiana D1-5]
MNRQFDKQYPLDPKSSLEEEDYFDGLQTSGRGLGPSLDVRVPSLKVVANGGIIAVPGLGADPCFTWTKKVEVSPGEPLEGRGATKSKSKDNDKDQKAHLLLLLKQAFPTARILCYVDNTAWFREPIIKTPRQIGICLQGKIKAKRLSSVMGSSTFSEKMANALLAPPRYIHRPQSRRNHHQRGTAIRMQELILYANYCEALCADPSKSIISDTVGIIFLGTPHQGARLVRAAALLAPVPKRFGLVDDTLIKHLTEHNCDLSNLADSFDKLRSHIEETDHKIRIAAFYESKPVPGTSRTLVSRDSAIVHADAFEKWLVNTDHSNLNKCSGVQDSYFVDLTKAIARLRCPSRLQLADSMIHNQHYNANRLKITRLSGHRVNLSHCYINLAIEQEALGQESADPENRNASDTSFPQEGVEDLDSLRALDLKNIFDRRNGCDGAMILPRRIMIRGRAGVGKSTLCKKIVHEFVHDEAWRELFHRILWIPLRHLARTDRTMKSGYCLISLFQDEFFPEHHEIAEELARDWSRKRDKTLFVLDGLDEVSQVLESEESGMKDFIERLLEQPNLIVTSRSHVSQPALGNVDLRAEVLGFHPDQVIAYLEADPKMCSRIDEFHTWLNERWVLRGLVRTPILLDALCLVWDSPGRKTIGDTMTGIYIAITQELRSKDIKKLDFDHSTNLLDVEIKSKFQSVETILEHLAFSGLASNIEDFTTNHRNKIAERFWPPKAISLNETLGRISFMRSSDGPEHSDRDYHFMHRTFQEFFAAQYFVRWWICSSELEYALNAEKPNEEHRPTHPDKFLEKYKYTAQYDVFWRLVTGLIATEHGSHLERFFAALEQEPIDLLGPAHQRLIMHCLAEVAANTELLVRSKLELMLSHWAHFEYIFGRYERLIREPEFPMSSLILVADNMARISTSTSDPFSDINISLGQLEASRRQLPESMEHLIFELFTMTDYCTAGRILRGRASLSKTTARAIKAVLEDAQQSGTRRMRAAKILRDHPHLVKGMLVDLTASLESEDPVLVIAAAMALGSQVNLAAETQERIEELLVTLLENKYDWVRIRASKALIRIETMSETTQSYLLQMARIHPDEGIHELAIATLRQRAQLSETIMMALVEAIADVNDSRFALIAMSILNFEQAELPGRLQETLVEHFQRMPGSRPRVAELLGNQETLSEKTCTTLSQVISDKSIAEDHRRYAIQSFNSMVNIPWPIVVPMTKLVTDDSQNYILREIAASTLCREDESPAMTEDLQRLLEHDSDSMQHYALYNLIDRDNWRITTEMLCVFLQHQRNSDIPLLAAHYLKDCNNLARSEEETLVRIINTPKHEDSWPWNWKGDRHRSLCSIEVDAAEILARQIRLSEEAQNTLLLRLQDLGKGWKVRHLAALALGSHLSFANVSLLLQLLEKRDIDEVCQIATIIALVPDLVNVILKLVGWHANAEQQQAGTAAPASWRVKLITGLYEGLLDRGFREQVTLCVHDNACIIDQPQGRHRVPLHDFDLDSLRRHIAWRQQLINKKNYMLWSRYG